MKRHSNSWVNSSSKSHISEPAKRTAAGMKRKKELGLRVEGCTDQNGGEGYLISKGGRRAFLRPGDLLGDSSVVWKKLYDQGVKLHSRRSKNELLEKAEAASFERQVVVIDETGWFGDVYKWPGRQFPKSMNGLTVLDTVDQDASRWLQKGCAAKSKAGIERFAGGQIVLTLLVAIAFVPYILRLVPEVDDNLGIELFSDTSAGKSTALRLVASIISDPEVTVRHWDTTVSGIETVLPYYVDGLLPLDEANLFLDGSKEKDALFVHTGFKLTAGTTKVRYGQEAHARQRLVFLTTTNRAIAEVAKAVPRNIADAVRVRILTVPADRGKGLGIFDCLPKGCKDSAAAIAQMAKLAAEHHGWLAREFIEKLEYYLSDETRRNRLLRRIRRYMKSYRRWVGARSDGPSRRKTDKLALGYAAGELANKFGIIELDFKDAFIEAYRLCVEGDTGPSGIAVSEPLDPVEAYMHRHRDALRKKKTGRYLNDRDFNEAAGFVIKRAGETWLAVRPDKWREHFGGQNHSTLKALQADGRLWGVDGLQRQMKLRESRAKDRVYCVKILAPLE